MSDRAISDYELESERKHNESAVKQYSPETLQRRREHKRQWQRQYFQDHKQESLEHQRKYRQEHKQKCREFARKYRQKFRQRVFEKLGGKCVRCGFSDPRALQIDHVNGGGTKEHREIGHQRVFYLKVFADTEGNYQLLCANCNCIKKSEKEEHTRRKE